MDLRGKRLTNAREKINFGPPNAKKFGQVTVFCAEGARKIDFWPPKERKFGQIMVFCAKSARKISFQLPKTQNLSFG